LQVWISVGLETYLLEIDVKLIESKSLFGKKTNSAKSIELNDGRVPAQ